MTASAENANRAPPNENEAHCWKLLPCTYRRLVVTAMQPPYCAPSVAVGAGCGDWALGVMPPSDGFNPLKVLLMTAKNDL